MERVCINYANLLDDRGYEVTLMNLTTDAEMIVNKLNKTVDYHRNISQKVPSILKAGFKNIIIGNYRLHHIEEWIKNTKPEELYKKLITEDSNRFDIEIAFYGGHMMKIISGSHQKNSLKIGWIHSPEIERHSRLFNSADDMKNAYRKMDILMCVSGIVKEKAILLFGDSINPKVLFNPNDVCSIRKLSAEPLTDVDKRKFTFINASRIDIQHKGFDRLVAAAQRLIKDGFSFDIWVLGDGKDKNEFENLLQANQMDNTINYLGSRENPYHYIANADCYICSSRYEGFSMVVAETVIIGTPVISTDISGAREMLGDSEYGLVVENSEEGIYQGMKKVLSDSAYWEHLKEQAQERRDFLSEEKIMQQFESIINEEMSRRKNA